MTARAVFLDRDGTLIEDVGHLSRPEDVVWYPDTVAALSMLRGRFELFVVSNQSGVSLGETTMDDVHRVNRFIDAHLARNGIVIRKWYVCPHARDEGCVCIKPRPYFPEQAARQFGVSLRDSYAIGDHPHDVTLATGVGGIGLYLLTGHGKRHREGVPRGTPVFASLRDAASWIIDRETGSGVAHH